MEAVEAATLVTLGVAEPLCQARRVGMVRPLTADVGRMHPGFRHLALQYHPFARSVTVLSTDLRSCNACRPPQTLAQRVNYASLSSLPLHEARPLAVLSHVPGSPTSMHKRASIFMNVIT